MASCPETPESIIRRPGVSVIAKSMLAASLADAALHEPSPASTYGDTPQDTSAPATPEEETSSALPDTNIDFTGNDDQAPTTAASSGDSFVEGDELDDPFVDPKPLFSDIKRRQAKHAPDCARATGCQSAGADLRSVLSPDTPHALTVKSDSGLNVHDLDEKPVFGRMLNRNANLPEPISAENAQAILPPKACVFVANLSSAESDQELTRAVHEVFERFGPVWVKIRRDSAGMPYAFCQYETEDIARLAIVKGRSKTINGRPCRTEPAKVNRSVYISKLSGGPISESEVREKLREFGPLESLWWPSPTERAMYSLPEGIWIKFGYFQNCRDMQNAFRGHAVYKAEQPSIIEPNRSVLRDARAGPRFPQSALIKEADRRSLFVGNLPMTVTRESLLQDFGQYGTVRGVDLIARRPIQGSASRCFAFVEFSTQQDSLNAMHGQNGRCVGGRFIRVQPKESTAPATSQGFRTHDLVKASLPSDTVKEELARNTALLEQQRQVLALQSWQIGQANGAHANVPPPYSAPQFASPNGSTMNPAPVPAPTPASNGPIPNQPWPMYGFPPAPGPTVDNGGNHNGPMYHGGPSPVPYNNGNHHQGLAAPIPHDMHNNNSTPPAGPYQHMHFMGQFQYPAPYFQGPHQFPMPCPPTNNTGPNGAPMVGANAYGGPPGGFCHDPRLPGNRGSELP
ncbi:MAG: RNA polymerase II mediator complex subunit [Chaenotheca gracillima]|nr:MAG: RNA polymerase II mediator complex subunit [Chaenotheca gracillima]